MLWHIDGQHVFRTQGLTIPATFDAIVIISLSFQNIGNARGRICQAIQKMRTETFLYSYACYLDNTHSYTYGYYVTMPIAFHYQKAQTLFPSGFKCQP